MAGFNLINNGLKMIYSRKQAPLIHVCILALAGTVSVISTYLKTFQKLKTLPDMDILIVSVLLLITISIYLTGYGYNFMHNAFNEKEEPCMPDFDVQPFKIFWNMLPLGIAWILYYTLLIVIGISFKLLIIPVVLLFLFMSPFVNFIFVAYSKNFDKKGLYNATLPFKYIGPSLGDIVVQGLCFIPLYIVFFIVTFTIGMIAGFSNPNLATGNGIYIIAVVSGYFSIIIQYAWNYSMVQIYKEKLEQITE